MARTSPRPRGEATPQIAALIAAQEPGRGLAGDFYNDPAIYARDLERIFERHWMCAGHASSIPQPGDYLTVEVGAESVIIARARDGALGAMLNVCRHRGSELCAEAFGHTDFFVCPYHAWTYGLDGRLAAARLMPPGFDLASHGLRRLHLSEVEGLLFVSFAARPLDFAAVEESLASALGPYGWREAKVAHRERYAIAGNWKLAVENYVECYHCSPAHPEYSKLHALEQPLARIAGLNARMGERTLALGLEVAARNLWRSSAQGDEAIDCFRYALYEGVATGSPDGAPVAPLMGDFTGYDGGVTSVHVGGASFLLAYPDHGVIYRFVPKGIQACAMELIWLVRGDARRGGRLRPGTPHLALAGHECCGQAHHRGGPARRTLALLRTGPARPHGIQRAPLHRVVSQGDRLRGAGRSFGNARHQENHCHCEAPEGCRSNPARVFHQAHCPGVRRGSLRSQ